MTIDELIKELNEIKKKKGGNTKVFYMDSTDGTQLGISEVEYTEGGMTSYSGVTIS